MFTDSEGMSLFFNRKAKLREIVGNSFKEQLRRSVKELFVAYYTKFGHNNGGQIIMTWWLFIEENNIQIA